jgi:hypothetical protein
MMELEPLPLGDVVNDFANAMVQLDATGQAHKSFQSGIGPWGEADAVRGALARMRAESPSRYGEAKTRRVPDLLIPGQWAIEVKIVRPFGDNGKLAEHWSENVLHPYAGNTSSLGDCLKLLEAGMPERKAVLIYGFEHAVPQIAIEAAICGFEILAGQLLRIRLGRRISEVRSGLIHPVHQRLLVFGFEVLGSGERL